ncbi:DUF2935 domain-containing protein [Clostridium chromiireducens]|uniref:DUF2935 domain-containing protein n=1 Tax=Clostridium chromiireducens TaxID=225345 RepID=A0A964RMT6_9CLOT|nr:DUF2935 domain-containing protein [Clostridium chromiireducens]MVX64320.1 DUF2935 domain-containing protein [Clostridium chromiireducens]
MLSKQEFINQSLELNLFFLRIMKEHSIFMEAAIPPKNKDLISQADAFKNEFSILLTRAISLADGIIPSRVLSSNEIVTKYTLDAERATQFSTGIFIDTNITSMENSLYSDLSDNDVSTFTDNVYMLNHQAITTTNLIIRFKTKLKNDVLTCKVFTTLYPSLINHILSEAIIFMELLTRLQKGIRIDMKKDLLALENFWDDKMSEHGFTIRGMLDPTEKELFIMAHNFGKEFETFRKEASQVNSESDLSTLTEVSLSKTIKFRDFKAQATEGLLTCKIKSVILPLLADHVLRESNHYINLLRSYDNH